MTEIIDGIRHLITPVTAEDISALHIGDMFYLSGSMTTCRDVAHRRVVEEKMQLPVDVTDGAIFHAGPIVRETENGFEMVSVGPTTSMRMEKFEYEFVKQTGVRVIIGKGGMSENTVRACREYGVVHCIFPAGNAVIGAVSVVSITGSEWRDLGMPETLWSCKIHNFGPLIVSIDSHGNNLVENRKKLYEQRKIKVCEEICRQVGFIK